jgi:hypothetical protein
MEGVQCQATVHACMHEHPFHGQVSGCIPMHAAVYAAMQGCVVFKAA